MGENCTSEYPEELLNPNFTPIRIMVNGKIQGSMHTLTLDIDGKKTLVIPGIEPKKGLMSDVNAKEFLNKLMEGLIENIAIPGGYDQMCFTTSSASQSNRPEMGMAINRLIKDKPTITQDVQENFPSRSYYSIEELRVVWERPE